jgi:hypothetical protein
MLNRYDNGTRRKGSYTFPDMDQMRIQEEDCVFLPQVFDSRKKLLFEPINKDHFRKSPFPR